MNEMLKYLAEASGWTIPAERMADLAAIYESTAADSRAVRECDITGVPPTSIFIAE